MTNQRLAHSRPTLADEEAQAAADVVRSGYLAYGPQCREFEEELAVAVGRKYAVVMANGHSALEVYLESLRLPVNTEVQIPSYSCSALRHSVHRSGLVPEVRDVEEKTLGIGRRGGHKGPVIAANMFAVPCRGAESDGFVLEDCAMGFVPGYTGARTHASLLSFYATKMFTSGQGGALLTDDASLASEWRQLLQYDNQEMYRAVGNRQLTDIQAAVGRVQLKKYTQFLDRRRELFALYQEQLKERGFACHSMVNSAADKVLFRLPLQVKSEDREALIAFLNEQNIEAKSPVWKPLHRDLGMCDKDFSVSVSAYESIVSLPFFPSMRNEDVSRVVMAVAQFHDMRP